MSEVYQQIILYLVGIWRRRWYALVAAWIFSMIGWVFVATMPDRYESSTRIYVDMDTMLGPLMKGLAVEMNLFQQIDIMRRTLLSRPNIEKIILMTDLDLQIKDEEQREKIIEELGSKIRVRVQGRNLFTISTEDEDPAMAKRIVQAVMQIFVEGNLGASRKDMETTRRFLDGQIRDKERLLVEAEARLAKFKRDNMGMLPGEGNFYDHMQQSNRKLAETQAQINEASMIRDELKSQLAAVPQFLEVAQGTNFASMPRNLDSGPESDVSLRIMELERAVESMLSHYTEKHPDVQSAKRRLEKLRKQLVAEEKAQQEAMADGPIEPTGPVADGKTRVSNPVYEQIKLQLVQQEGVVAALNNRAKQQKKNIEKWTSMAKLVPQVEAQLAQLNRDYSIVKKGYQELRARQESAKLARDLETKASKVQFRIIDPPKLPVKPSGPNRPLFFAAVMIVGLGVGIVFAFLLSQINSTFPTTQKLSSTFTLPVLGRISAIISEKEKRWRRREIFGFSFASLCLIGAFVGLIVLDGTGGTGLATKLKGLGII